METQPSALDARVNINKRKISTIKAQLLDLKDHKASLTKGEKKGGFKCVCCKQLIAYAKKVFACPKCFADHWLYFQEQETSLREQVEALEDEILSSQDKQNLFPETKEKQ